MKKITKSVYLNSIERVKNFTTIAGHYPSANFDLKNGKYIIDGKSIMGIFSLNLTDPIELTIEAEQNTLNSILFDLKEFFV